MSSTAAGISSGGSSGVQLRGRGHCITVRELASAHDVAVAVKIALDTVGKRALAALLPQPAVVADHGTGDGCTAKPTSMRARRLPWADLLRRVFADDVLRCDCGGARIITAFVADGPAARATLDALGLASQPAALAPARAPPQVDLDWAEPS